MKELTLEQLQKLELTINLPDGTTFYSTLGLADEILYNHSVSTCILGLGIGVVVLCSLLLAAVARTYKSVLFCLYQTSFAWGLIVYSVSLYTYLEKYHNITATYFTLGANDHDIRVGVFGSIASLMLTGSLLASLCFQVYAAYKSIEKAAYRITAYVLVALSFFQTVFIWTWSAGLVIKASYSPGSVTYSWANNAAWPSFGASTMICSLLLTARLYEIVRSRAKLGLEKFDTIKIILIIAVQNATIPSFFAFFYGIYGLYRNLPEGIGGLCTILCCVFFPAGYIWTQAQPKANGSSDQPHQNGMPACNKINTSGSLRGVYWNGGAPTPTSGNSAEYGVDKEGNRFKAQEIV